MTKNNTFTITCSLFAELGEGYGYDASFELFLNDKVIAKWGNINDSFDDLAMTGSYNSWAEVRDNVPYFDFFPQLVEAMSNYVDY